jgi:hypothetical protein
MSHSRTFLSAGHAGADISDILLHEVLISALCVTKVRVSSIDDDVTLREVRQQLLDGQIHCASCLNREREEKERDEGNIGEMREMLEWKKRGKRKEGGRDDFVVKY